MNNTYSVIYSLEARNDIKGIYSYIAYELLAPENAEGQVNRIRNLNILYLNGGLLKK